MLYLETESESSSFADGSALQLFDLVSFFVLVVVGFFFVSILVNEFDTFV